MEAPEAQVEATIVACGAASHLRLKLREYILRFLIFGSRMWSGFSSEIETLSRHAIIGMSGRRMWSGFSSEIETTNVQCGSTGALRSHVERLLI